MGLTTAGATVIGAGIAAASGAGQAIATGKLNRKNRKWQDEQRIKADKTQWDMYNQSLQDNRENWHMQNAYAQEMYEKYQSPEAQMRQLQEAGLNPYLSMYGGGTNSGAPQTSGMNNAGQAQSKSSGNPTTNDVNFSSSVGAGAMAMSALLNKRTTDSQLMNDEVDRANTSAETALKYAKLSEQITQNEQKLEDLRQSKTMNPKYREKIEAEIRLTNQRLIESRRKLEQTDESLRQGQQRINQDSQRIDLERMRVQLQSRQVQLEAERVSQGWKNLSIVEVRNNALNRLTESQNYNTKEAGRKIVAEIDNVIKDYQLKDAQIRKIYAEISLLDAKQLESYISSGGKVVDILKGTITPSKGKSSSKSKGQFDDFYKNKSKNDWTKPKPLWHNLD